MVLQLVGIFIGAGVGGFLVGAWSFQRGRRVGLSDATGLVYGEFRRKHHAAMDKVPRDPGATLELPGLSVAISVLEKAGGRVVAPAQWEAVTR